MAKLLIEIPDYYHHHFKLEISVNDLNYGNHMANDSIAQFANEARVRCIQSMGYSGEMDVEGLSFIMTDYQAVFLSEAFHRDELSIYSSIIIKGNSSFDLIVKYFNETQKKDLAISKSGLLFFDYSDRKVARIPEKFSDHLKSIEKTY